MTKKAKTILMLVGAGVVALLIVLALFGNTYARYTSAGESAGGMTVALWDLETTNSGTADGTVKSLSPSMDDYDENNTARTHESGWAELFEVTNYSDVKACVELSAGDGLTLVWAEDFEWGVGWNGTGDYDVDGNPIGRAQTNAYGQKLMARFGTQTDFDGVLSQYGVLTLQFGYTSGEDTTPIPATSVTLDSVSESDGTTTYKIYAEVVWTSVYDAGNSLPKDVSGDEWSSWKEYSDAVDTILCMYLGSVSFSVAWTAYQASTT